MTYRPDLVLYHDPCNDGICAAAVVANRFGHDHTDYRPANYSKPQEIIDLIDECRNKHVLLVDYTFKPDVMAKVEQSAQSIVVIDHHVSAQTALQHYENHPSLTLDEIEPLLKNNKVLCCFDMKECGSSLAHRVLFPDDDLPLMLDYIRTVDLHLDANNPDVDGFKYWSRSVPLTVDDWQRYVSENDPEELQSYIDTGKGIAAFARTRIGVLVKDMAWLRYNGGEYPFVITDYAFASDACNTMVDMGYDMAVAVYLTPFSVGFSLRSRAPFDVSKIAASFGGGGHAQAAGFNIPIAEFGEFMASAMAEGLYHYPRYADEPEEDQ